MKPDFFSYCIEFMKTDDFKKSMRPFIQLLLQEIYPYIYISMLFVFVAFFIPTDQRATHAAGPAALIGKY